ncbi:MAG: hypothetical protein ACI97A_001743 [Planctomycetota bacterium]|jgi:hypothetical protein
MASVILNLVWLLVLVGSALVIGVASNRQVASQCVASSGEVCAGPHAAAPTLRMTIDSTLARATFMAGEKSW